MLYKDLELKAVVVDGVVGARVWAPGGSVAWLAHIGHCDATLCRKDALDRIFQTVARSGPVELYCQEVVDVHAARPFNDEIGKREVRVGVIPERAGLAQQVDLVQGQNPVSQRPFRRRAIAWDRCYVDDEVAYPHLIGRPPSLSKVKLRNILGDRTLQVDDPQGTLFGFGVDDEGAGSLLVEVASGTADDLSMQTFVTAEIDSGEEYGTYFPAVRCDQTLSPHRFGYLTTTENPTTHRVNVGLMATTDRTSVTIAPTTLLPTTRGSDKITLLEIGSIQGIDEFSGSATVVNHSDYRAEVRADFCERGAPGILASRSLTINAGEAVGFEDLVGELFGYQNTVGTVVLESTNEAEIRANGREFALLRDPEKYVVGTAGTGLPGLTESDMPQPGFTRHIIGLRQEMRGTVKERSHLAVFNPGPDLASIFVSLVDENGAREGSRAWTVASKELIHINGIMKKINPEVDANTKRLEITSNSPVYLHAFRVNSWGDSVTMSGCDRINER